MFFGWNGTTILVNCTPVPNGDVSGSGVRTSFYIQITILILLSLFDTHPDHIAFSNLYTQSISIALVGAAYFDPTIDVPHTLIASQFAVLFSSCRIMSYDLPLSYLRTRAGTTIASRLWLLDIAFRTGLSLFNLRVWSTIILLQAHSPCKNGFGKWDLFGSLVDLQKKHPATTFAYVYCILDGIWEACRLAAEFVREYILDSRTAHAPEMQLGFDPRFWLMGNVFSSMLREYGYERFNDSNLAAETFRRSRLVRIVLLLVKISIFIVIATSVEGTVKVNALQTENHWSFGQIFAVITMLSALGQLMARGLSTRFWSKRRNWILENPGAFVGCCFFPIGFALTMLPFLALFSNHATKIWHVLLIAFSSIVIGLTLMFYCINFGTEFRWEGARGIWRFPIIRPIAYAVGFGENEGSVSLSSGWGGETDVKVQGFGTHISRPLSMSADEMDGEQCGDTSAFEMDRSGNSVQSAWRHVRRDDVAVVGQVQINSASHSLKTDSEMSVLRLRSPVVLVNSQTPTVTTPESKLRNVVLPDILLEYFLKIAEPNTRRKIETGGMLCGALVNNEYTITRLLIPPQTGTIDTVTMTDSTVVSEYHLQHSLLMLGWIHTHPTQTCFLSSIDLHTQLGLQLQLSEAISIVCAPTKRPSWGVFRLTDPFGLTVLRNCDRGNCFHSHTVHSERLLYEDCWSKTVKAGHVRENHVNTLEVIDLRKMLS